MARGLIALAAAFGALAIAPAAAPAEVVWLCKPGVEPNPCHGSLQATVYDSEGSARVEDTPLPANPPVDCFYVYPTVSEQPSRNASKDKDRELFAVARHQAARFSQVCRVFAPVYRQQTLLGVGMGGSAEALQLAYGDVVEAWNHYLEHDNRGRGVVLIGHSQGTRMLRGLVRKEIDPRPEVRSRLVSAVLLGGNVTVRRGRLAGGDFEHVPGCSVPAQTGCAIAFSTYNEPPPANARFGRVPAEDTSGFGFPTGPDYEVLCTSPASLGANERRTLSTYVHGEPFPGFIGLLLVVMYGGPQPSAPTPWLVPPDRYAGRCETHDGANVLMVEPIGDARRLNPSPEPGWGLHLADANIALGDLVAVVGTQAQRHVAAQARRTSRRVSVRWTWSRGRRGCVRHAVRARLSGVGTRDVTAVRVRIGRRTVARDTRAPFAIRVRRASLRRSRAARLTLVATLTDGRTRTFRRTVRACAV